ncbi:DNA topoisomerase-3 [Pseudomonas sp. PvP100]|nr:DNA topoisomerase-3 [Pseudomonas sp. PvP007]MBP1196645.1 DNA topoisomerase-3 [Pseudomonas sp. PvP100]RMO48766.1 DEAD/DEAH box helicase [Pseudomonas syringae]
MPVILSQAEQEECNQITRSDQHRFARLGALRQPLAEDTVDQQLWQMLMDNRALASDPIPARIHTRDTTSRMKRVLEQSGLKVAVLRASVDTARREDWILDQVDRGVDVLITNPELVKTGLDLLDFPTIAFMQTGYNVYTVQQAARRSWRIGQKQDVRVIFFGYIGSSQITCLQLMAKKIAVSQSTSGDVPESGLDSLNQDGDSVEMALARQLINS